MFWRYMFVEITHTSRHFHSYIQIKSNTEYHDLNNVDFSLYFCITYWSDSVNSLLYNLYTDSFQMIRHYRSELYTHIRSYRILIKDNLPLWKVVRSREIHFFHTDKKNQLLISKNLLDFMRNICVMILL